MQLATPLTNITANYSNLPSNVSEFLQQLQKEYNEGDLTEQGLIKRQSLILLPYTNVSHEEQGHGFQRRLLSLDETELVDWINNSKKKQISLASDMERLCIALSCYGELLFGCRAIRQWEWQHGPWVS